MHYRGAADLKGDSYPGWVAGSFNGFDYSFLRSCEDECILTLSHWLSHLQIPIRVFTCASNTTLQGLGHPQLLFTHKFYVNLAAPIDPWLNLWVATPGRVPPGKRRPGVLLHAFFTLTKCGKVLMGCHQRKWICAVPV